MTEDFRKFEAREGYLAARLFGPFTAANNLEHLRAVMEECQRRGFTKVLFDTTRESGDMSFLSRFYLGDEAGTFWDRAITIAVFALEEQIDRDRFAVKVAQNRGILASIFSDENEAVQWLLAPSQDHAG